MKKTLLALAALSAFAGAASAQSSVTLFGVLDAAGRSVKNGNLGSIKSEISGGNSTSRWGVRGTEDLGGGLSAGFWLESAIAVDTGVSGSSSSFFNRRSTVSLASQSLGEVRLGYDKKPTEVLIDKYDAFGNTGIAAGNQFNAGSAAVVNAGGALSTSRVNNSVQYFLPGNLGGVNGVLWVTAGEGAAAAGSQNKSQGARLGYAAGPVDVAIAAVNIKNAPGAPTASLKDIILGGSYDFGLAKVSLSQRQFKWNSSKAALTLLGVTAPVGPGQVRFSYQKANQSGATPALNANDASLFALGYVYDLSKRTALYGTAARISNKGAAIFTLSGGPAVTVANFGGQKSTGYEFGIRHNF
jgi:predicted porin